MFCSLPCKFLSPGQLAMSLSPANKSAEELCVQWLLNSAVQFFLLDDRLCYSAEQDDCHDVRYVPLDRIPVRALPRGYGPQIGVTVIEDR